ncbi:alpha/beta hydrolase [Streptomyces sp. GC420]|uniref:alpha/beta hydrolase n=1 Tax=Streptomyces sp. GC420 TaxID=2697568 RepID=UPI001414ED82|nr:alpha/beta hydrolase [Streptomyces sp. GC420]NBM17271.1 alpha/beta hydrolase [Streptomyces sp. GC420]
MNHLEELKEFARLHARGQGMTAEHAATVLTRITNDTPGDPDSWASVWTAEGDTAAARGDLLDACRHYALARFPYHDDADRARAQRLCVDTFDRWRRDQDGIERLQFEHPDGTVACWAAGLDASRPLLVVMGGIVSVKEQWAPLLPLLRKLGFAAVVTELPGVGENTCAYGPDSWRTLGFLLDRLADRARVDDTSMLALSFSGHLAMRAAAEDPRIRRVLTVGAPVAGFFADTSWWPRVPGITADTLRSLTRSEDLTELRALLPRFALTPEQLRQVRIPVRYVASSRDEIIPGTEQDLLRRTLGDVRFKVFDDVHGSPAHLGAMRRWLISQLLWLRFARRGANPRRSTRAELSERPS